MGTKRGYLCRALIAWRASFALGETKRSFSDATASRAGMLCWVPIALRISQTLSRTCLSPWFKRARTAVSAAGPMFLSAVSASRRSE